MTQQLVVEGKRVVETQFEAREPNVIYGDGPPVYVELQPYAKWRAGCLNLLRILGVAAKPWDAAFSLQGNSAVSAIRMLGTLEAIEEAIQNGLLVTYGDIVRSETFDSLLDQADYLLSEGYYLAAGALGRAVLEEHLRSWCDVANCTPAKARPTLDAYGKALYAAKEYSKSVMKHVDSMTGFGNDAAHNNPDLKAEDIARLLRDVREFLAKNALS